VQAIILLTSPPLLHVSTAHQPLAPPPLSRTCSCVAETAIAAQQNAHVVAESAAEAAVSAAESAAANALAGCVTQSATVWVQKRVSVAIAVVDAAKRVKITSERQKSNTKGNVPAKQAVAPVKTSTGRTNRKENCSGEANQKKTASTMSPPIPIPTKSSKQTRKVVLTGEEQERRAKQVVMRRESNVEQHDQELNTPPGSPSSEPVKRPTSKTLDVRRANPPRSKGRNSNGEHPHLCTPPGSPSYIPRAKTRNTSDATGITTDTTSTLGSHVSRNRTRTLSLTNDSGTGLETLRVPSSRTCARALSQQTGTPPPPPRPAAPTPVAGSSTVFSSGAITLSLRLGRDGRQREWGLGHDTLLACRYTSAQYQYTADSVSSPGGVGVVSVIKNGLGLGGLRAVSLGVLLLRSDEGYGASTASNVQSHLAATRTAPAHRLLLRHICAVVVQAWFRGRLANKHVLNLRNEQHSELPDHMRLPHRETAHAKCDIRRTSLWVAHELPCVQHP